MPIDTKLFAADVVAWDKYARHLGDEKRRESWSEAVDRNKQMHLDRFPAAVHDKIHGAFEHVHNRKVLPSMRSMQFGGKAIEQTESRVFNCAFVAITRPKDIADFLFNQLAGTGTAFSVQRHHIEQLPAVRGAVERTRKWRVADTIEGWADAAYHLVRSHFDGSESIVFDYSDIRAKGSPLKTTGGRAPGHEDLKLALDRVDGLMRSCAGRKLADINVLDVMCMLSECVASGGIRRSAALCSFDMDSEAMLTAKKGWSWFNETPWRVRSNNSAMVPLDTVTREQFFELMVRIEESGAGEPGIIFTNTLEMGVNPCAEISLYSHQFCNLSTINMADVRDQREFEQYARAASFIGTLQASYTNFHFLSPKWRDQTELEALIGVSQTGIANNYKGWLGFNLAAGAAAVLEENEVTAAAIGINKAARTTTGKPEGTGSIVAGMVASGIHSGHNKQFVRRVTIETANPLFDYLASRGYPFLEEKKGSEGKQHFITIPIQYDDRVVTRESDTALSMLERTHRSLKEWVHPGHRSGENRNNQSVTLYIKDKEWGEVAHWIWERRRDFTGLSFLPYDGGNYEQTPFEDISSETYELMTRELSSFSYNLDQVIEEEDGTVRQGAAACSAGGCEV